MTLRFERRITDSVGFQPAEWCYAHNQAEDLIDRMQKEGGWRYDAPDLIACDQDITKLVDGEHEAELYGHPCVFIYWGNSRHIGGSHGYLCLRDDEEGIADAHRYRERVKIRNRERGAL